MSAPTLKLETALLLALGLVGTAGCWEPAGCGNATAIWVHRVVPQIEACEGCITAAFRTSALEQRSFRIHREPEHVVGRCGVLEVEVRPDGVALMLSRDGYEPMRRFRESVAGARSGEFALLRLEGSSRPFAVLPLEDLRRRIPVFDFESEAQIEQFLRDLGVAESARARAAASPAAPVEGDAARQARALLEQLQREDPLFDRLRGAVEGGEDEEAIRGILRELGTSATDF